MKIRYVGPHTEVTIAATGQKVARGKTVEVSAAVGKSLSAQSDWKKVTAKKKEDD